MISISSYTKQFEKRVILEFFSNFRRIQPREGYQNNDAYAAEKVRGGDAHLVSDNPLQGAIRRGTDLHFAGILLQHYLGHQIGTILQYYQVSRSFKAFLRLSCEERHIVFFLGAKTCSHSLDLTMQQPINFFQITKSREGSSDLRTPPENPALQKQQNQHLQRYHSN